MQPLVSAAQAAAVSSKDNMILRHAIVADDNHIFRQGLVSLLLAVFVHTRVQEAQNGAQVLDMAAVEAPDLIIMDVDMPQVNGLQATSEIKSRWPSIRVIILVLEHHHRAKAADAGADACLFKGVSFEDLLATVAQLGFDVSAVPT